jgi:hypothetical protein
VHRGAPRGHAVESRGVDVTASEWAQRTSSLTDAFTSRFTCARKAARWRHLAAGEMRDDAAWALSWAARWREAGKALPGHAGLIHARARRICRLRNEARRLIRAWDGAT